LRPLLLAPGLLLLSLSLGGCARLLGIDEKLGERRGQNLNTVDGGTDAGVSDAGMSGCTKNSDCSGDFELCSRSTHECVPLFNEQCREVTGSYQNESALLLGSIFPLSGANASTGISNMWGVKLAAQEFALNSSGLPALDDHGRRPVVVLHCDDAATIEGAAKAARHLTEVGVSAIIGPSFSGITVAVSADVAVPNGVLLMSPAATSASITDQLDNDLLWRTAPSDVVQAAAQAKVAEVVGQKIREAQRILPNNPMKLALLHKGDPYGSGLAEDVARSLIWNSDTASADPNAPYVVRFNYGDPGNPVQEPVQYDVAVAKVFALLPHLVLLYGTAEVAELVQMIEAGWDDNKAPRPRYVFADGGHTKQLGDAIAQIDPEGETLLADRVVGTEPGSLGENYELFRQLYSSKDGSPDVPITFGSANAYDALYVLAYASVAAGKARPSGSDLAAAIGQLVPATGAVPIAVGTSKMNAAMKALTAGGRIDMSGASGPLDFDLKTGDVLSSILVWCAQVAEDRKVSFVPTREAYDPIQEDLVPLSETRARCGQPWNAEEPFEDPLAEEEEPLPEEPLPEEPTP
jgi:ABC-type branched-subunit amino acid transport system substrate-binding protein